MKKLVIIPFIILLTLMCSCSQNNTNFNTKTTTETATIATEKNTDDTENTQSISTIDVLSYDTNKTLASYSTDSDDPEKIMLLLDAVNYLENTTEEPDELPIYVIHFIDENDSKYDMWYNVYIYKEKLYIQVDTAKTESITLKPNAEIKLNTQITPDKFSAILENKQ